MFSGLGKLADGEQVTIEGHTSSEIIDKATEMGCVRLYLFGEVMIRLEGGLYYA